ncbi:MAG TPA: 30S ribosomal protein S4 [Gammaproteobacteria bacterium]|nr:30S ribosomal protein S4 [Gammaproteobacteria bacterium]
MTVKARAKRSRSLSMDLEVFSSAKSIERKCKFKSMPGKPEKSRVRFSDYAIQLRMKQAVRDFYGLKEKVFKNYFKEADRLKGSTSDNLLILLEKRLDNVIYRLGFACTRREARQMVVHNHILVNGKKLNRPSYLVRKDDVIGLSSSAKAHLRVQSSIDLAKQKPENESFEVNYDKHEGSLKEPMDLSALHNMFKVNLVIELYSK